MQRYCRRVDRRDFILYVEELEVMVRLVRPFGDLKAELRALRETVGAVDAVPYGGVVEITGSDRSTFLHNMCTNDIGNLAPGGGCELFLANVKGKTLAYALALCRETSLVLVTAEGRAGEMIAHLDRYIIREDVQLHDRSEEWASLLLAGGESDKIVGEMLNVDPPGGWCRHETGTSEGRGVRVCAMDQYGAGGFLLTADVETMSALAGRIADRGVLGCGLAAAEVLRIESGLPMFGADITEENFPQEVGRDEFAVSFTKGCYLGQETVARIDALGHVNRLLCGLRFECDDPPLAGTAVSAEGSEVGRVTSAVYSPRAGTPIALAYLKRGFTATGTQLQVKDAAAHVVELPMPVV
ncbi:MAG: glycine cleavage T C-terminal barrel domain-containing protein [Pirellulales bacterium]